jgi:glycerophosphoryl diester phosphodiesterase
MDIPLVVEKNFHRLTDTVYAAIPRPVPEKSRLQSCKIVSHRGEHDNRIVFENSLAAFDRCVEAGLWGVECDVRWTADGQPVIFHDPDFGRLFGSPLRVDQLGLEALKSGFPMVPTLAEVIRRYGAALHLMIEFKQQLPDTAKQRFKALLSPLTAVKDYHLLSQDPERFAPIDFISASAFLPVAQLNAGQLSRTSLKNHYGGITGHYLLLTDAVLERHRREGQQIGTGFVGSKNVLFRELNRGVTWIFSNHGARLKRILDARLVSGSSEPMPKAGHRVESP